MAHTTQSTPVDGAGSLPGTRRTRPSSALLLAQPVVLLGAGGMLHRAWHALLRRWSIAERSLARRELDLARPDTMERALPPDCRLVINCAAYTGVDAAETDEPAATAVNGAGVGALALWCAARGAMLVHYSTDYVFDGRSARPFRPHDQRRPLNAYGRSKALGEQLVEQSGCQYLMIRTSWLYAPWSRNFVRTIVGFLRNSQPLRIVNDQRGRPTSSEHLAAASLELLERGATGIYHVTDGGECTWFEFALEIGRMINPAVPIEPCTTAELPRPAPRPRYSVLDLEATEQLLGAMPPWQSSLAKVVRRIEPPPGNTDAS